MHNTNKCPICLSNPDENSNLKTISWLQCDICSQWFHTNCLKVPAKEVESLLAYHCSNCAKEHGPSARKRMSKRVKVEVDYAALNEGDTFAVDKSIHPHVHNFLQFEETANETDLNSNTYIDIADSLSKDLVLESKLAKPMLISSADHEKVGMKLPAPAEEITIDYITQAVGDDSDVEVMDVLSQQGISPRWNMGQWNEYFHLDEGSRDRIRNVISLEISAVEKLGKNFIRPQMVRDMDLVDKVWHDKTERPKVTKYCLMSVTKSFTDFHIDFSGTSVYYTICSGSKTFLMFPPTNENLSLYTSWCLEPNQNFTWFPFYTKALQGKNTKPSNGFKVTLKAGDLFIIPSGWIHAVYTHEDSIVIGGNFLTLMDMKMHLKIGEIEKATRVPSKFRFPFFNKVLWFTSWYYFNNQREFLMDLPQNEIVKEEGQTINTNLRYEILRSLILQLKSHYELSKTNQVAKKSIPTFLIGKNIPHYLQSLDSWLESLQDTV